MKRALRAAAVTVCFSALAAAQTRAYTIEADPDVYFDRGVTLAVGWKPSPASRWTVLGDFASRKLGPLENRERLDWRVGGGARYRFTGQRSGFFGQLNLSADQVSTPAVTAHQLSVRPGTGFEWHPWKASGFYCLPLLSLDAHSNAKAAKMRGELRIGWQH